VNERFHFCAAIGVWNHNVRGRRLDLLVGAITPSIRAAFGNRLRLHGRARVQRISDICAGHALAAAVHAAAAELVLLAKARDWHHRHMPIVSRAGDERDCWDSYRPRQRTVHQQCGI
jgi:hypothetical protein